MFKVTNNEPRFLRFPTKVTRATTENLVLSPGANLVSDKDFEIISKLKGFKTLLKSKVRGIKGFSIPCLQYEEMKSEKGKKDAGKDDENSDNLLSELSIPDAKAIVDETKDVQTLKKWAEEEGRATLKKHIQKRFDALMEEYTTEDEE